MEKPRAITTSKALIFLLEIFLNALLIIPKGAFFLLFFQFLKRQSERERRGTFFGQLFGLMAFLDFHSPS
jgi:hypothetical protein